MTGELFVFYALGLAALLASVGLVVFARSASVAAACLFLAVGSVAGIVALLGAPWIAAAQLWLAGATAVALLLFAVMLEGRTAERSPTRGRGLLVATGVAALGALGIGAAVARAWAGAFGERATGVTTAPPALGLQLFGEFALPTLVLGFLLLAALVGTLLLARAEDGA